MKMWPVTEQHKQEAVEWVHKNGSEYLKGLVETGSPFWAKYVEERCAREFPEFVPDTYRRSVWLFLSEGDPSPTPEQVELAKRYGGRFAWLAIDAKGWRRFRPAVVIQDAIGYVDLVEWLGEPEIPEDEE